ncbi:hypothetical protein [Vitiosangium sp. GDMCC 1.1324]|uniref:hypothetical protein n=1 Tax=Vitiosangium sp. (strain GDMCC 1.1324) TaxID=2138576 RepID=UPI000D399DB8|nr:hypothetical protein [Vitiosangium sp. GDMCC 1.1324]PTL80663.1 hypothetical protein DAT35_28995 [Vitiosangium sp. GDMCC 1.1324]
MTTPLRTTRRAFTALLGTALLGGGAACGLSGTGGRGIIFRMGLRTALAPGETEPGHFTTDTGWRVALSSALMVLGPIYLFENPSPLQKSTTGRWLHRMGEVLAPTAHAHDTSFFSGGRVLGEWDREVVFDLLAAGRETRVLGRSPGIAGVARSFSLLLQPPSRALGAEAEPLEGRSVLLEGTASRDGRTLAFRAALDFPPPVELQRVEFVPMEVELDDDDLFVVELQPHRWFEGTLFERLEVPASGAAVAVPPESQVHRALFINVRRQTAFCAAWEPSLGG